MFGINQKSGWRLLFAALLITLLVGCSGEQQDDTGTANGTAPAPTVNTGGTAPGTTTPTTEPAPVEPTRGSLSVELKYDGQRSLNNVEIRLLDSGMFSCESAPWDSLPSIAPKAVVTLGQAALFADLKTGNHYRVVAFSTNGAGYRVARGCIQDPVIISPGSKSVSVDLSDILPKYSGKYKVRYTLDLSAALPDSIREQLEQILGIVQNPGLAIVDWLCEIPELEGYCSDQSVREVFGAVITELVMKVLKKSDTLSPYVYTTNDVISILTAFQIESTLSFDKQPNSFGNFEPETSSETMNDIRYRWTWGADCDPKVAGCGVEMLPADLAGLQHTSVPVTARIEGLNTLHVEEHSFQLQLGTTLGQLLEKSILPRLMNDEKIDSFESFIQRLLGGSGCLDEQNCCEHFGQRIENALELVDFLPIEKWATKGCKSAAKNGARQLRKQLEKYNSDKGLTLSTSKQGCTLYDSDKDLVIDSFGSNDLSCMMDAVLELDGKLYSVPGTFTAERILHY